MRYTHGANIDEVERLARRMSAQAARLEAVQAEVERAVRSLGANWGGEDLAALQQRWPALRQSIFDAASGVRDRGDALRREAEEQRRTSSVGAATPSASEDPRPSPLGPGGPVPVAPPLGTSMEDGPEIPFVPGKQSYWWERLNGDEGDSWVPQGLAYDPGTGLLLTTMYSSDTDGATGGLLALQDRETGEVVGDVRLEGIDHYGGVAVHGDHVWVSGGGKVQLYSLAAIREAESGSTVPALDDFPVKASSTVTYADGHLFVADFTSDVEEEGKVYSYRVDGSGHPSAEPNHEWTGPRGEIQGIAVDDHHIYLSHSEGRYNESALSRMPRNPELGDLGVVTANEKHMAEGIALVDGDLYTTYESGAEKYSSHNPATDPRKETTITELD